MSTLRNISGATNTASKVLYDTGSAFSLAALFEDIGKTFVKDTEVKEKLKRDSISNAKASLAMFAISGASKLVSLAADAIDKKRQEKAEILQEEEESESCDTEL